MPIELQKNFYAMWGVLICFRHVLIHLSELDKSSNTSTATSATQTTFTDLISSSVSTMPTSPSFSSPAKSYSSIPHSNSAHKLSTSTKSATITYFNLINLCEIYELCIHVLNSNDNRLVTSSLEVLQVLIRCLPFKFDIFLTSIGAMGDSFLFKRLCISQQTMLEESVTTDTDQKERESNSNDQQTGKKKLWPP